MLATKLGNLLTNLLRLPKNIKKLLIASIDAIIFFDAVIIARVILNGANFEFLDTIQSKDIFCILILFLFILILNLFFKMYDSVLRYSGFNFLNKSVIVLFFCLLGIFIIKQINLFPLNYSILILSAIFYVAFSLSFRVYFAFFVKKFFARSKRGDVKKKILIYGAGYTGRKLSEIIRYNQSFEVMGYIDDSVHLQGRSIDGLKVYSVDYLSHLALGDIAKPEVILAISNINSKRKSEILLLLSSFRLKVGIVPSVSEMLLSKPYREINESDLLGREPVDPDCYLLSKKIEGQSVMITGAGGSIGGEIARQVAALTPKKLILIDHSEVALYEIIRTLSSQYCDLKVIPLLISVCNEVAMNCIMKQERPSIVFHAAAYKHVPLVEINPIQGLINNVIGTYVIAKLVQENNIQNAILISTDKAVRPSNIMGASKRIAEMIFQRFGENNGDKLNFSIVRFGNVLGSSGSVVPKFLGQIRTQQTLTLTHREITRYFMTIPEAAQLVIQVSALGGEGKIFLLDMGDPIRIKDLAIRMIGLHGLSLKDKSNPDGDIEIVEMGLRKGEKMYEELLIDPNNSKPTIHSKIFQASESSLSLDILMDIINKLRNPCIFFESADSIELMLTNLEIGYAPNKNTSSDMV